MSSNTQTRPDLADIKILKRTKINLSKNFLQCYWRLLSSCVMMADFEITRIIYHSKIMIYHDSKESNSRHRHNA